MNYANYAVTTLERTLRECESDIVECKVSIERYRKQLIEEEARLARMKRAANDLRDALPFPSPVNFKEVEDAIVGLNGDAGEQQLAASAWEGERAPKASAKAVARKASKHRAAKRRRSPASRTKAPASRRRKGGR